MRIHPAVLVGLAAAAAAFLASCAGNGSPGEPGPVDRGPAPPYAGVAARYNARAAQLDRFHALSTTRIWYLNREGEEESEQADGALAYMAPRRLLLTVNRLGETYAILGSDAERYWWIDLTGDQRSAIVGHHDQTTPEAAQRAGLPVHPLDLRALLGVAPLPGEGEIAWSDDGRRLLLSTPGRWGDIVTALDPETLEPAAVTLLREGREAVTSELSDYTGFYLRDAPGDPRMPGEAMIRVHESGARIRMNLSQYRAWGARPSEGMFYLEQQLESQRIPPQNVRRVEDAIARAGAP